MTRKELQEAFLGVIEKIMSVYSTVLDNEGWPRLGQISGNDSDFDLIIILL